MFLQILIFFKSQSVSDLDGGGGYLRPLCIHSPQLVGYSKKAKRSNKFGLEVFKNQGPRFEARVKLGPWKNLQGIPLITNTYFPLCFLSHSVHLKLC